MENLKKILLGILSLLLFPDLLSPLRAQEASSELVESHWDSSISSYEDSLNHDDSDDFVLVDTTSITLYGRSLPFALSNYRVADVPNVQLRDYTKYLSDSEDVIAPDDELVLNEKARILRDSLDLQLAIVVLSDIDREEHATADDFATALFNDWGIGSRKTDRGFLILLLTSETGRELVMRTGRGIEGDLPDGLLKLLQQRYMIPSLKEGDWGKALIAGVTELETIVREGSDSELLKEYQSSEEGGAGASLLVLGIFAFIGFLAYRGNKRQRSRGGSGGSSSGSSSSSSSRSYSSSSSSGGSWGGGSSNGGGASSKF